MRRILPTLLVGIGILLIAWPTGWLYFSSLVEHPAAVSLPDQVANLQMTEYITGTRAAAQFENLHNKQFPLTSGAIGIYGDLQITLWVAGAPLNLLAARMVDAMEDKISQGNSPFSPIGQYADGNRTIYELEGMGQKHFYFQSNNLVIWLAADPSIADEALKQTLEVYP